MNNTLLPCPFCNSKNVKSSFNRDKSKIEIKHIEPCILSEISLEYWGGEQNHQELIDDWNTRKYKSVKTTNIGNINGNLNIKL